MSYEVVQSPGAGQFEAARLQQMLSLARGHNAGILLEYGGPDSQALDEETIRRLRALGYIR